MKQKEGRINPGWLEEFLSGIKSELVYIEDNMPEINDDRPEINDDMEE